MMCLTMPFLITLSDPELPFSGTGEARQLKFGMKIEHDMY